MGRLASIRSATIKNDIGIVSYLSVKEDHTTYKARQLVNDRGANSCAALVRAPLFRYSCVVAITTIKEIL